MKARKEFLKTTATEYKAILEVVYAQSLSNPNVAFSLYNNGKLVFTYTKKQNLKDRILDFVGQDVFERMLPIRYDHPHIQIHGYIGKLYIRK